MKNNHPGDLNLNEMEENIKTNHVGGIVPLDRYAGSDINLQDWTMTEVLDDVLLIEYADETEDGKNVIRGGIVLPTNMSQQVWRIGKIILAGPKSQLQPDQYVMFPNDRGLISKNVNGRKRVVFLNEGMIFGVVKPNK